MKKIFQTKKYFKEESASCNNSRSCKQYSKGWGSALNYNTFTKLDFIAVTTTKTGNLIPSFNISPQSTLKDHFPSCSD